jgi:CRISPR system Cascade subunit CasC
MNMQKSAVFGGVRRVRVSSQSLKRAMRKSEYYACNLGEESIRTKHLSELKDKLNEKLVGRFPAEIIAKTIKLLSNKDVSADGGVEGDAVAPWAVEEFAWFCEQVKNAESEGLNDKALQKQLKSSIEAMRKTLVSGLDIALSGRMATSGLMSEMGKVDGALAVAHALTTHSVDSDIDWFTAVDDLQEQGSGHLDTQEFSSGVFYRYASLNLKQLQVNLGLIPDMAAKGTPETRNRALEIASHVLQMLATVVPSAKQQSFAAHNLADLALVSFSDLPVSLANAFEQPVQQRNGSGYRGPSIAALHDYWQKVHNGYGLAERCGQFSLSDSAVPEGIVTKQSLENLKAWVRNNGEG